MHTDTMVYIPGIKTYNVCVWRGIS